MAASKAKEDKASASKPVPVVVKLNADFDVRVDTTVHVDTAATQKETGGLKKVLGGIGDVISKAFDPGPVMTKALETVKTGFNNLAGYSSSFGNTMTGMSTAVGQAVNSVGAALAPAFQAALPVVQTVTNAIITAMNAVAAFTARLFGNSTTFIKAKSAAAGYSKGVTGAAKSAEKAKLTLASFDQLNRLEDGQEDNGAMASEVSGGTGMFEEAPISGETVALTERMQAAFADIVNPLQSLDFSVVTTAFEGLKQSVGGFFNGLLSLDFAPLGEALAGVAAAAAPLVAALFDGLGWFLENVAGPLAQWAIENLLPAALDVVSATLGVVNSVVEAARPALSWLWEELLKPMGEWAGGLLLQALEWLNGKLLEVSQWINDHQELVTQFITIVGLLAVGFVTVQGAIGLAKGAFDLISGVLTVLSSPAGVIFLVVAAIAAIVTAAGNAGEMIDTLKGIFQGLMDFITGVFTGDWEKALGGIKNIFKGVFNGVVIILESAVNLIIRGINGLISKLNAIQIKMPAWVESMFGVSSIGFNIPKLAEVQIPRLAQGAVIPPNREFMAVLGDQRSGTNIETPEGLLRQIFREESGNSAIVAELREILAAIREGKIMLVDGKVLGRVGQDYLTSAARAGGMSAIPVR